MNQLNGKIISIAIFIAMIVLFDFFDFSVACRDPGGFQRCVSNCPVRDVGGACFRKCLSNYC